MKLLDIKLENFKRHRKLEVPIRPGLVGLVGSNGSGKSSFLSSMAFAITGTALNDDTRDKMITWGEKNGSVTLTFEHNGKEFVVTRQLGKLNATLEGEGVSIKGVNPVNAEMQRMAGTPFDLFKGVMFVAQAALDTPLRGTEASRKEAFGKLFDCQRFDRLRDVLQEGISRLQGQCSSINAGTLDELNRRVSETEASLQGVNKEIEDLKAELAGFDLPALYKVMNSVAKDEASLAKVRNDLRRFEESLKAFEDCDVGKWDAAKNARETAWYDSILKFHDTGVCPMCKRPADKPPIPKEEALARRDELVAEKVRMEDKIRLLKMHADATDWLRRLESAEYTQEEITKASNRIRQHTQLECELREKMSRRGWCEGTLADTRRAIEDAGRKLEATERARRGIETLEAVRNAFHRDCVQKAIRSYGARQINDRLAGYLAIFSLPYLPSFDDDGLLRFMDPASKTTHEFADLSGGQGNLVALAYRLALMQMFSGNVRVAILDEPTYGVDKQNLEAMCESFKALSEYAGQRGLSIFVATHEETLFPSFDQVIQL